MTHLGVFRADPRAPCVEPLRALHRKDLKKPPTRGFFNALNSPQHLSITIFRQTPCQFAESPYGQFIPNGEFMKLIKRNVLLEGDQLRSLAEMAIRKRTSVNELVRLAVDGLLNDQLFYEFSEKAMCELKAFADREERRLVEARRELMLDFKAGVSAFNQQSERHIERSTDLTKTFVLNLSEVLGGDDVPLDTKKNTSLSETDDIIGQALKKR